MELGSLVDSFAEFKDSKNIDRETLMNILTDVYKALLAKKYGNADNFDIIINPDRGDFDIYRNRTIVADGEVEDENTQIAYSEAIKVAPDFEIGEELSEIVPFDIFGRREILSIRQTLVAKVQEYERVTIFNKYSEKKGEIIIAEVHQVWKREVMLLDEEGVELSLPKEEQIPMGADRKGGDVFRKGDTIKAVVLSVTMRNGVPKIIVSRVSPIFLERLFEQEVPEIYDGLITIKDIVRQPGERAKVAVETYDDRIDPVGTCVGIKGSRIHGIVKELHNENIDVVPYTSNMELYIARALNPAKVDSVHLYPEEKKADVYMNPDQVSLAIGKGGFNIRLASKLTGYTIEIYRNEEINYDDVLLDEFSDEIEQWVIDVLKSIGCDTAKDVLALSVSDLEQRTDLEPETIKDVLDILQAEFEEEE
ncbi:MAG: transcription termination factor NusA [Bacteroidales bacterium]|jgi:N utilization substance protein A|nr:transcription termination factor NusA [Bacteroidales bacterium]